MKITKNQLKQMIKEEMEKVTEGLGDYGEIPASASEKEREGYERYRKAMELRRKRLAEPPQAPKARPAPSMPEVEEASIEAKTKEARQQTSSERGYKSNSYRVWLSNNPGSEVEEQIKDIRSRLGGIPGTILGYYKDGEQVFAYLRINTF